jgi:hypothetical protein
LNEFTDLPDDLLVMNCALCRAVMVGADNWKAGRKFRLKVCGGRLAQRPYCRACYAAVDYRVVRRAALTEV